VDDVSPGEPGDGGADPRPADSGGASLAFLARASAVLAGSLDHGETLRRIAELAVPEIADACALELAGDDDGAPVQAMLRHADPSVVPTWRAVLGRYYTGSRRPGPRRLVLATGEAQLIETTDEYWDDVAADADHAAQLRALGVTWILALPLAARGRVLGVMTLVQTDRSGRRFAGGERAVSEELARRAALAVDNALLFRTEQDARAEAERARRRWAVLAEASKSLAASLDFDLTLQTVAHIIVPAIADHVVIDLVEDGGAVRRVASVGHGEIADVAAGLLRHGPTHVDDDHFVAEVLRTNREIYVAEAQRPEQPYGIAPGEHTHLVTQLEPISVVLAPMMGRTGVVGVLSVTTTVVSNRRLTPGDVELLTELAQRSAVAVEHARLFSQQRDVALTLQRRLLPASMPSVPGLRSASRYLPAGHGTEVGGDWYDLIPLPGGLVAAVMGDVEGRGVAAAARMGQLRNAVLAYVVDGYQPAAVLTRLNRLPIGTAAGDLATLLVAVLDPETGQTRMASAGHPPPLLLGPGGEAAYLDVPPGPPVGALANARFRDVELAMIAGSTLVLFTDGVFERRGESVDVGLERLRASAATFAARAGEHQVSVDELVDHVLRATSGEVGDADDDAAILAVHFERLAPELKLRIPAEPAVLAGVRATLRRWLADVAGARDEEAEEIVLAAGEACANAVEHAYGPQSAEFELVATVAGGAVAVTVRDDGRWRTPRESSARGRGRAVMEAFMDAVEIETTERGTRVVLRRRVGVGSPART